MKYRVLVIQAAAGVVNDPGQGVSCVSRPEFAPKGAPGFSGLQPVLRLTGHSR